MKIKTEQTFLKDKTPYIIYYQSDTVKENIVTSWLMPVRLDWIIDLNPIYFYLVTTNRKVGRATFSWDLFMNDGNQKAIKKIKSDFSRSLNPTKIIRFADEFPDQTVVHLVKKTLLT